MNEKKTTETVAKMIALIHGRPRQTLNRLSDEEARQALVNIDKLAEREKSPGQLGLRAAIKVIQYKPRRIAMTQPVLDDTILAKAADRDPGAVLAKIHATPQRCILPQLGSCAVNDVVRKRMEEEH